MVECVAYIAVRVDPTPRDSGRESATDAARTRRRPRDKWAPPRTTLVALGASRVAAGAKSEAAAGASAERNICVVAISRDTDLCGVHWARRARAERAKKLLWKAVEKPNKTLQTGWIFEVCDW